MLMVMATRGRRSFVVTTPTSLVARPRPAPHTIPTQIHYKIYSHMWLLLSLSSYVFFVLLNNHLQTYTDTISHQSTRAYKPNVHFIMHSRVMLIHQSEKDSTINNATKRGSIPSAHAKRSSCASLQRVSRLIIYGQRACDYNECVLLPL